MFSQELLRSDVVRVDQVIPSALAEVIRKAPLCPEKVDFAWRSAVGVALARATTVRLDAEGVLHVRASNPQWSREAKRLSRIILPRLARLLGDGVITRIRA